MAEFSVEATGVASYRWQWKSVTDNTWGNTTAEGNRTATMRVEATEARYNYEYRCKLTGNDGSVIYTDAVHILAPYIEINDVRYKKIDSTSCKVIAYVGSAESVEVRSEVNGMIVVEIGEEAFMNNTTLESIKLPSTITVIRARAFKGCTSLREMN